MEGSIDVQGGFFESQSELCSYLNAKLWEQIPRLKGMEIFSYVKPMRRFSINTEGHHLTICFKNRSTKLRFQNRLSWQIGKFKKLVYSKNSKNANANVTSSLISSPN